MNKVERIVALVLVFCIFIPTVVVTNAYATLTLNSSADVQGATYYNYSVYGSVSGNTADVDVIKFNIADDIIPMAYATQAGKANVLNTHVQAAVADGYEVIGAINASFFDMSSGDPCGALISNGKLIYDHAEKNDTVITAFDINGTPTLLGDASLSYALNLNGTVISSGAIGMVNKDYTACNMVTATISTRFHYYDSDAGSLANTAQTGYEILCKKLNGTDIAVGKTLQGEVISVTSGYYGKTAVTADDQFVLFVKSSSTTYAGYATSLSAGSSVTLTVTANNSWANEVLSGCHSAVSSTYWLVQNGTDLTDTTTEIIHNTSTVHRAWTAFGWDDNGNYYFFTSQENKLSLKDAADAMISMGATNVLRLDGGGSTTMYVNGYGLVENAGSRAITDSLLIVKKPNVQGTADNLASDRNYTISVTNDPVIDTEWNTDYSANLTDGIAEQTFASDGSWFAFNTNKNTVDGVGSVTVDFDNLCDITQLKLNLVNQSDWGVNAPSTIKAYSSLDGVNYTYIGDMPLQATDGASYWSVLDTSVRAGSVKFEFTLNGTWAMVNELEVHGTETAIAFPYEGAADNLASDRDYTISVTNDPIIDATWNNDYSANLTDGVAAMEFDGSNGSWFAFSSTHNTVDGVGTVTVNFDKVCDITKFRLSLVNESSWGVYAPTSIKVYGSLDGVDYIYIGDMPTQSTDTTSYWSNLSVTNALYGSVKFEFTLNGTWAMVNELEVYGTETETDFHTCKDSTGTWYTDSTSHWHKCSTCGKELDKSTHTFGEWYESASANCTEGGENRRDCTLCKYSETQSVAALGHSYTSVVTAPTCTAQGYTTYTCGNCGDSYAGDYKNAIGHDYASAVTAPTCTAGGYTTYTCGNCGDSYTSDKTNATGHSFGEWYTVTDAGCESEGLQQRDCANCDHYETQAISATGHNYTSVVTAPTCTAQGYTTYTCGNCGNTYNGSYVNATGHSYTSVVTEPTCTAQGYTTYTCTACGYSYTGNKVAALGHSYGEWYEETAAACTESGVSKRDCANCDHYETETIAATGHDYDSVVAEPTCESKGYTTYTCGNCGDSYIGSYVSATGHDYASVVTDPTCTAGGYTTYTCNNCGDTYTDNITNALGHSYGEWYTSTEPECESAGEQKRDCANCDHYETKTVSATGHNYTSVVTAPTCLIDGYTTHTCDNCGDSYTTDIITANGHIFGDWHTIDEPTCTETGMDRRDCENCTFFEFKETAALGHDYTSVVTAPTCTEAGYTTHTCGNCGDTYTDAETEANGHSYTSVVTAPTCVLGGYTTHTCDNCGDTYTDTETEANGHNYTSVVTAPTCTTAGYTTHTCTVCGDSYTDAEIPANGHNFGEWYTVTPATADKNGEEERDCQSCSAFEVRDIPALGHNYQPTIIPPTCLMAGYTRYYCDCCGNSYTDTLVDPLGHNFGEWYTVTEPTCTDDGEECRECLRCAEPETKVIEAQGHSYTSVVTDPTCTTGGYTTYTCNNCGDSYTDNITNALGHSYGEWYTSTEPKCETVGEERRDCDNCDHYETNEVCATGHDYTSVVTEPTCTEAGYTTHTCGNCGDVYTDTETEAQGHSYKSVVTEPTCTTGGYTTHTCTVCGDTYTDSETEANGHTYGEWVTTTEPKCETTGEQRRDCDNCDHYETNEIPAAGHDYASVVTESTCESRGYTTYTCGTCGNSYVGAYVPATGHDYDSVVTAPTCIAGGYTTYTCHCGDTYTDNYTTATGHTYGEWVTTTEAKCETVGEERRDCDNCDHYETRTVPATGHDYGSVVTKPTCVLGGYTTYTCGNCGDEFADNATDALGHSYNSVVTAPTCTEKGYTIYTCHCGDSYIGDETSATGHSYGEWFTVNEAGCETVGLQQRDCANCDHYETQPIAAQGHSYKSVVTEPTCTERGYTTYTCHCNDSYIGDYIAATGHSHETAVTAPTCTAKGYTTYICHCGDSYNDNYVNELGHNFNNYQSDNNATCTEDGTKTSDCGNDGCNETSTVTDINTAKGHTPMNDWTIVKDAELGVDGLKELHCDDCDETLSSEIIPAIHQTTTEVYSTNTEGHWYACDCGCNKKFEYTAHTPGVWETTVNASIDIVGKKELRCTECNYLIAEETIPALHQSSDGVWHSDSTYHWQECSCGEHLASNVHTEGAWVTVKKPEIGIEGKKEIRCSVCNALLDEEIIPALEDTAPSVKLLRGDINQNGKIDARDYLLLKRAYFGTYELNELTTLVADVNNNGKLDARDYLMLKRAYFGTYTIPENIKYITQ